MSVTWPIFFPAEISAALPVAGGAISAVERGPATGQVTIDLVRPRGRSVGGDPFFDASHGFPVQGRWQGTGSKGRAAVAFFHGVVVAVPMKPHAPAFGLVPDRWEIAEANPFARGQLLHGKVQQDLRRIESIDPAWTRVGFAVHEAETLSKQEQTLSREADGEEAEQLSVQPIIGAAVRDFGRDPFAGEGLVEGAGEQEPLKTLEIHGVRRHASDHSRRTVRSVSDRAGVADGAVEKDAFDALDIALRHPDGQ